MILNVYLALSWSTDGSSVTDVVNADQDEAPDASVIEDEVAVAASESISKGSVESFRFRDHDTFPECLASIVADNVTDEFKSNFEASELSDILGVSESATVILIFELVVDLMSWYLLSYTVTAMENTELKGAAISEQVKVSEFMSAFMHKSHYGHFCGAARVLQSTRMGRGLLRQ